ncbi:MAG: anion permease [Planctomycetes bacterium]|nr:anion permease [Planctomycetota bacterium]
MLPLAGGVFLGWSLGANDAANIFGTAVASRIVRFSTAAAIAAVFIVAGAALHGERGLETMGKLAGTDVRAAVLISAAAAVVVTAMTWLRLPVSTTQAVGGAALGVGLATNSPQWALMGKMFLCWVATPIGAIILAMLLYSVLGLVMKNLRVSMLTRDRLLSHGLIVAGAYGAYALGGNNVANVTGVYVGTGMFDNHEVLYLSVIGGGSIALGVVTYSRRVMMTVGAKLVRLDAYAALVVVVAQAITVDIFTMIGIPVSTSQAVIGGVIGVGFMRGVQGIHVDVAKRIGLAWVLTPVIAAPIAGLTYHLLYGSA